MGPIKAVVRCYVRMLNFSARARRKEFWWFMVFQVLFIYGLFGAYLYLGIAAGQSDADFAALVAREGGFGSYTERLFSENIVAISIGYMLLSFIPALSVTVRRLHDTDRSGFWYFITLLPVIGGIWLLILLLSPGTRGPNRFGADPITKRKAKEPSHPAFASKLEGEDRERAEAARRAAAQDYYQRRVLPSIQRS